MNTKNKILFVSSSHPPFDTRIYHKMFFSLKRRYKNIKILISHKNELANRKKDFITFSMRGGLIGKILSYVSIYYRIKKYKPNLIIFFDPDLLPLMLLIKNIFKPKVIYDNHEDYPNFISENKKFSNLEKKIIRTCYIFFEKIGYYTFDYIIFADNLTPKNYDVKNKNISIIYNYPIFENFQPLIKYEYDVIFPGSIDLCYDRILKIIKATNEYSNLNQKIKFLVIGRGVSINIVREMEDYVKNFNNVKLDLFFDLSYASVQKYIQKSKVGIIPLAPIKKMHNNIPTKLFEFLMHGKPQVASQLPPISQYFNHMKSGFLVREENYPFNYATKIVEILKHYEKYKKNAMLDRKLIKDHWNWSRDGDNKIIKVVELSLR